MKTSKAISAREAVLFYLKKHYVYPEELADHLIGAVQSEITEELTLLRAVEAAARMLTIYCPAEDEHRTENDCKVYGCREGREALSALDAFRQGEK